MHKTTIEIKMQYAIIIVTFTAIVTCQVDEFISPDTYIPEAKDVNDLVDLTKAIKENKLLEKNNYYSDKTGKSERIVAKTVFAKITTLAERYEPKLSLRARFSNDMMTAKDNDYDSHEIGDFENIEPTITRATTIKSRIINFNDESLPSLRELVSKDIIIENVPAPKLLQIPQTHVNLYNEMKTTTNVENIFEEAAGDSSDVRFDEIKNDGTNGTVINTKLEETSNSEPRKDEIISNTNVFLSKFLKMDNTNGDITFSLVDEASDISESNPRKVYFANPVVNNGTDLLLIQGEPNKSYLNPRVDENDSSRPKDFSKSTFVGVPMNILLTMLRSKANADGENKKTVNLGSFLQTPADLTNGVLGFIKSSARNIGDIVFEGR